MRFADDTIRRHWNGGVRDVVVGYCSVTVYFDPLAHGSRVARAELLDAATAMGPTAVGYGRNVSRCRSVYGGEYGRISPTWRAFAGARPTRSLSCMRPRPIVCSCVGFVPGFAYMAAVDPRIAAPRRATPRTECPPASVAIAAGQTGIYPVDTPGGWNIIGRTPLRPYDPARTEPLLFQPGDRVRFRSVSEAEFARLTSES